MADEQASTKEEEVSADSFVEWRSAVREMEAALNSEGEEKLVARLVSKANRPAEQTGDIIEDALSTAFQDAVDCYVTPRVLHVAGVSHAGVEKYMAQIENPVRKGLIDLAREKLRMPRPVAAGPTAAQ